MALSTCESEYIALSHAVQESIFLVELFSNETGSSHNTVFLFADNQGAISLAKNPVYHQKSKHISIKYHFIGSHIENGSVKLMYIPSEENLADIFTKPMTKDKLLKLQL